MYSKGISKKTADLYRTSFKPVYSYGSMLKVKEELAADEFVSAFFMPRRKFKQQIQQYLPDDATVNIRNIANYPIVLPKFINYSKRRLSRARKASY